MPRRKLTPDQKIVRRRARAEKREATAAVIEERRAWHQSRADAAKKAVEKARAKREKAKAKEAAKALKADRRDRKKRGVPEPDPFHRVSKHGTTIDSTLGTAVIGVRHITGNHEQRRAAGQRGHVRKPRRRELPRAIERREAAGRG